MALKDRTDTLIKQFAQNISQNVVNNQGFSLENKINDINKSLHDECREELVLTEKDLAASDTTANKVILGISDVSVPRTISISPAEEFDGNAIIIADETGLAAGIVEIYTIVFPSGGAAAQADYVSLDVGPGYPLQAFLRIDGNPAGPGSFIIVSNPQIGSPSSASVDILSTDTAAQVAAKFLLSAPSGGDLANVSVYDNLVGFGNAVTDNLDGTITIARNALGDVGDAIASNSNNTATGSMGVIINQQGGARITVVSQTGKLIDGAASKKITDARGALRLYYTGTAWFTW